MPALRLLLVLTTALSLAACDDNSSRPAPTPTVTSTATRSPIPTSTATPTSSASPTASFTASPTPTSSATASPSATPTSTSTATPAGVTALFRLDALDAGNPFPSDRQRDAEGNLIVSQAAIANFLPADPAYNGARNYLQRAANDLQQLDGFSTFGPIRIVLDGEAVTDSGIDPTGVFLVRLAPPFERVPIEVRKTNPAITGDYALEIKPRVPLAPRTTYAFGVTKAVTGLDERPLLASSDFANALCNGIESVQYATWREATAALRQHLQETEGLGCPDFVMLDFMTTQSTMDDLVAIRDLFDDGVLPIAEASFTAGVVPGITSGFFRKGTPEFDAALINLGTLGGSPDPDALSAIAIGTFPSFEFRGPSRAFDPARVAGETVPPATQLVFYMAFPAAPPPPSGYPVVIYGHGLSRNGADAISTATSYPEYPMVWAGISAVSHGNRGNFIGFFNFNNVLATRDNFRQTIADFLQFQRMLRYSEAPELAQLDRDNFRYYGISLGGIIGALYLGIESDIEVAMLSVPGAGLPNILAESELIGELLNPLVGLALAVPASDPIFPVLLDRFVQLAQWVLDPGDPINTAAYLLGPDTLPGGTPKKLLVHEGRKDTIVPNRTTEDLARAAGLRDLKTAGSCFDSGGCSGIWRFEMTEYEQPEDCGHGVALVLPEAHHQSIRFLFSHGTEVEDASPRLTPAERPECPDLSGGIP